MSYLDCRKRREYDLNFDRLLLGTALLILLSHSALLYVCLHNDLVWIFVPYWTIAELVKRLSLPASLESAIIENLFMLILAECFAAVLTIRFMKLGSLKSPALLSCIAILAMYHFDGSNVIDYVFDEIRFQANRGFYMDEAQKMEKEKRGHTVFDWGSSGFLDAGIQYYLVYDDTDEIADVAKMPEKLTWQDRDRSCKISFRWLSGKFYSLIIWCIG